MNASSEPVSGRFAGRTVVVTGAAAGIGRATAERLLAEGARVVAVDFNTAGLESLAAGQGGGQVVPVAGDLTRPEIVDEAVAAAGDRIDGVVNVAGITDGWLPAAEIDDLTWQRVFDLNVTAPMRLTRAVLPGMTARERGSLVYVSSEASFRSSLSGAAYTSSKAALNAFVKSVAYYYGPQGVRANAVAPGGVDTGMDSAFRSEYARERTATALATATPIVKPEVIVHSLLWLLSDDAPNVNGVVLPSDGGWSAV